MIQARETTGPAGALRILLASVITVLLAGTSIVSAQEPDTTVVPERTAAPAEGDIPEKELLESDARKSEALEKKARAEVDRAIELKIRAEEHTKDITKNIIIDEEGIIVNGKKYHYEQLEDSITSLAIESGTIIRFGEPVVVKEDEVVDGDLLSFGGEVTVIGTVSGDVAIIGADLHLLPSGVIKGDIFTFGGAIHQQPGGQIRGQRVGVLPKNFRIYGPFPMVFNQLDNLIAFGIPLLFFLIISFLFMTLAGFFVPRHVERIGEAIETAPLRSLLLGFAALVAALPLFILLCITIIGIPVALIAQPIAYFAAGIMGFAGISFLVGKKIRRGSGPGSPSPLSKIFIGALIIEGALILAWFLTLGGRAFAPLFWLFYLIGWIVFLTALMAGLGAVIWTRFGIRSVTVPDTPAPPVPPPPDADHPPANPGGPVPA
jgi:hypothetical protein